MKATSVLLAGAATALLLAPQSGRRTRRDIHRFLKEHCPKCSEKIDDIADRIAAEIETTQK